MGWGAGGAAGYLLGLGACSSASPTMDTAVQLLPSACQRAGVFFFFESQRAGAMVARTETY
uniref:Lipoprotein n=1 Tax=Aegilops tauschii subsp. strangulata TaxID=200361 RepID=A0A453ATL2_AEGTS